MARACGSCTLCCKLTEVPELFKPVNKWCGLCKPGKGCSSYEKRPPSCHTFSCIWLSDPSLSDDLRPDRCRVMLERLTDKTVLVLNEPSRPEAWRAPAMVKVLQEMVRSGLTLAVGNATRKQIILPEGRSVEDARQEIEEVVRGRTQLHNGPQPAQPR